MTPTEQKIQRHWQRRDRRERKRAALAIVGYVLAVASCVPKGAADKCCVWCPPERTWWESFQEVPYRESELDEVTSHGRGIVGD